MSEAIVGKWGKSLAVRFPGEITRTTGLSEGQRVEIEARKGDIIIRPATTKAKADAVAAAEEIIAEAERYSLDGLSIRELIDDGRPG